MTYSVRVSRKTRAAILPAFHNSQYTNSQFKLSLHTATRTFSCTNSHSEGEAFAGRNVSMKTIRTRAKGQSSKVVQYTHCLCNCALIYVMIYLFITAQQCVLEQQLLWCIKQTWSAFKAMRNPAATGLAVLCRIAGRVATVFLQKCSKNSVHSSGRTHAAVQVPFADKNLLSSPTH